jgi:hypothetical protein
VYDRTINGGVMHRLGILVFVIGCGSGCTDTEPASVAGLPVIYAWGNCQGSSEQGV